MYELNEKQIALVSQEVESAGINFSHLGTDLIDHVCCDIEQYMSQGISFNQAFSQVKEEFGIKGLRQIQQETLMLIDKNYRIMKKSMKTTGMLALSLMAFGALFKIMHWPGASIMLSVSFFFTSLVFFPTMLYVMYKEVNKKKQSVFYLFIFLGGVAFMAGALFKIMHWPGAHKSILLGLGIINYIVLPILLYNSLKESLVNKKLLWVGYLSLITLLTGLLFKIMHWPGASILLTFGSIILIAIAVPIYYNVEIKHSAKTRIDFLFGIIILAYFIIMTFLLSLNTAKKASPNMAYQSISYSNNTAYLNNINSSLLLTCNNDSIINLCLESDLLIAKIEELKISIIQISGQVDKETAMKRIQNKRMDIYSTQWVNFLLSENNQYSPLPELKQFIESYLNLLIQNNAIPSTINNSMNELFNMSPKPSLTGEVKNWESINFEYKTVSAAMASLTLWQYQVELNKNIALSLLSSNHTN